MSALWRKLVRLHHPDRFAHEPGKLETYEKLTSAINHARDTGDLATLREIANDPDGFIFRQGWGSLDFRDGQQIAQLKRLWESLELEIVRVLESTNRLRESAEYELAQLVEKQPDLLDAVAARRIAALEAELAELKSEAARLSGRDRGANTRRRCGDCVRGNRGRESCRVTVRRFQAHWDSFRLKLHASRFPKTPACEEGNQLHRADRRVVPLRFGGGGHGRI